MASIPGDWYTMHTAWYAKQHSISAKHNLAITLKPSFLAHDRPRLSNTGLIAGDVFRMTQACSDSHSVWLQMKYVTERRMAGAPATAASYVSSSHPRANAAIPRAPRAQQLKMGHRLKAKRFRDDIEKTEQSIAALQEHLRRVKRQLAAIVLPAYFTV